MGCRETRRLLRFRREWTPAEEVAARTHLESCQACQAVARRYELTDLRWDRLSARAMDGRQAAGIGRQRSARQDGTPAAALSLSGGQAVVLLALLAVVLIVAAVRSTPKQRIVGEPSNPGVAGPATQAPPAESLQGQSGTAPDATLRSALITHTLSITENVWSVAQRYGLRPLTLLMNNIEYPGNGGGWDLGPDLVIPPVDGTLYTVQPGDSLESIALRHNITVEAITGFELNRLEEPNELQPGRLLMLPGSTRSYRYGLYYGSALFGGVVYPPDAPEGSGSFAWPAQGVVTQGYRSGHYAIDIANDTGTPVVAADHGYVILAGKDLAEAGNQVLIGHGNGFTTRYTHLDTILVKTGDVVAKGQQIGTMGSTGQATAPHLHFEIVEEGLRRNPMSYLP